MPRFWVREIRNLEPIDLTSDTPWIDRDQDLFPGLAIMCNVPAELLRRVDQVVRRFSKPISEGHRYFLKHTPGASLPGYRHYHPDSWGMELGAIALLLAFGPVVRFGPRLGVEADEGRFNFFFEHYDCYWTFLEAPSGRKFRLVHDLPSVDTVSLLTAQLYRGWQSPVIQLACDRFVRACIADRQDATILELSIALECLYVDAESNKRQTISRRGATLLGGSPEEQETVYRNLAALYLLRNAIVHGGQEPDRLVLGEGREVDSAHLASAGLAHVAGAIRALLDTPGCLGAGKGSFLDKIDREAERHHSALIECERRFRLSHRR